MKTYLIRDPNMSEQFEHVQACSPRAARRQYRKKRHLHVTHALIWKEA